MGSVRDQGHRRRSRLWPHPPPLHLRRHPARDPAAVCTPLTSMCPPHVVLGHQGRSTCTACSVSPQQGILGACLVEPSFLSDW